MDAYEVLVIILAVALAVFLTLAIILTSVLIKLVNQIRVITTKADAVMDDFEAVSDFFKKTTITTAIGTLVSNLVSTISDRRRKK